MSPWCVFLQQASRRKTGESVSGNDDVIVDGEIEQAAGLDQLSGDGAILGRWGGVPARMVMYNYNTGGSFGDGGTENFAGVNQRAIEKAASYQDIAQDLALAVERK